MVELATLQRHNGYRELMQLGVVDGRMGAQRTAELAVEIVFLKASRASRTSRTSHTTLHEQLHGAVGEQPDTDIRQIEMVFQKL